MLHRKFSFLKDKDAGDDPHQAPVFLRYAEKIVDYLKLPAVFILFAYLCLNAFTNLHELDYFFHIKSGEHIVTQHEIPSQDIFSFTMEGKQWTNHEWLYQVMIYFIYKTFGVNGLFLLKAAVFSLSFFILILVALKIDWMVSFFVVFFGLEVAFMRFTLRPDNISFLFFILYLTPFIFQKRKLLWLLPFIQLLWVNIHGFFFLGPLVLVLYLVGSKLQKAEVDRSFYVTARNVLIASCAACFISPHPIAMIAYPFTTVGNIISGRQKVIYETIQELKSPLKEFGFGSLPLKFMMLTSLSLAFYKRSNLFYISVWLFTVLFALNSIRNFYFYIPVGIIILVDRYPYIKEFVFSKIIKKQAFPLIKLIFLIFIVNLSIDAAQRAFESPQAGMSYLDWEASEPLQIKSRFLDYDIYSYPQHMVTFMKAHALPARMYNNFNAGAYFIFNLFPERKIFLDGRAEVYGPAFLDFAHRLMHGEKEAFDEALSKYKLEGFAISFARDKPTKLVKLIRDAHFVCVYFERDGIIFVNEKFALADKTLKKCIINFRRFPVKKIDLVKHVKLHQPSMEGYYNMAKVLYLLGYYDKCREQIEEIIKVFPDHYPSHFLLAKMAYKDKDYLNAFTYCRTALFFNFTFQEPKELLAKLFIKLGDAEEAKKILKELGLDYEEFIETMDEEESSDG